jgi:hypothetical protein
MIPAWYAESRFQFDENGRLTEEYVRTGCRSLLRQLGADGR